VEIKKADVQKSSGRNKKNLELHGGRGHEKIIWRCKSFIWICVKLNAGISSRVGGGMLMNRG
jgi:hypothetical protein